MAPKKSAPKTKKPPAAKPKPTKMAWSQIWTVFLISAAMFAVGVMVGRGSAPVQFDIEALQNELLELRQKMAHQEEMRYQLQADAKGPAPALKFYDELKTTEKPSVAKAPLPSARKKQKAASPVKTTALKNPAKQKPQKKKPARPETATDEKALKQTQTKHVIQVASVKDAGAAAAFVEKLRKKGYPAYVRKHQSPGKGIWYRVQVGRYPVRSAAGSHLQKLKNDGIEAILVADR